MAEELQGLWTAKGLEKLATHAAGGAALVIEKLALGDGGGSVPTPQASWTALTQEVWRGDINGVDTIDDDPSKVQVDVIIPFSTGGFFIREWGLYDEDNDLIAVGAHAEFYKPVLISGAAAELTERILLPMANSGAITLSIPTQAMATQEYVQSQISDHNEDEEAHPDLLDGLDGLGDEIEALDIALGNHVADEDNPHNVTMEQLGWPCFVGQWVQLRNTEPPTGYYVRNGALIENASTTVPKLWAYLQEDANQEQCITQTEWTEMQAATYTLSDADETEVPIWDGVGGVPYYVLDAEADTLRLPDTRGMYAEDAGFDGLTAGGAHGDMIRNMTGQVGTALFANTPGATVSPLLSNSTTCSSGGNMRGSGSAGAFGFNFDPSRVVPTGNANKPRGYGMLGCIYAG